MIGQKFGNWTALEDLGYGTSKNRHFKCRCDCGTVRAVRGYLLEHGGTRSCGRCKSNTMVGRSFGQLKVLTPADDRKYPSSEKRHPFFKCKCRCGATAIVRGSALRAGETRSCGRCKANKTVGRRFGKLKALKSVGYRHYPDGYSEHELYECKCDCGAITYVTGVRLRTGKSKSCGCGVGKAAKKRWAATRRDSFLNKIDMTGGKAACWEWQGCVRLGYGMTSWKGKRWQAHRLAYTLLNGKIPKGKYLLHSCDNRRCCNPAHLRPGDQWENMQDMVDRKRTRGKQANDKNPMAKLSFAKARRIRRLYASGSSQQLIADKFGVSQNAISQIVRNKRYVE